MTRLMASRRTALIGLGIGTALTMTGCAPLSAVREPTRLFQLHSPRDFNPNLPRVDRQIIIESPEAAAGLATSRIALSPHPLRLEYFANANWTDNTPGLIQTLLVESFENTDKIISVGREAIGLRADFLVKTEVREFQAEYHDEAKIPTIRVRLNVKLVRMPRRVILESANFEYTVPAASNQILDIAAAFDSALESTLRAVVEWSLTSIDRSNGAVPPRRS